MQYKNLFFSGLLFALTLPLQILGEQGKITYFNFDLPHNACDIRNNYDYGVAVNIKQFDRSYCDKCVKIVYNKKYAIGRIIDFGLKIPNNSFDVTPNLFEKLEKKDTTSFQAEWSFVSCNSYGMTGECSNSSCDENLQLKSTLQNKTAIVTTTTSTIINTTATTTNDTKPTTSNKTKTSSIVIPSCTIALFVSGIAAFVLIKKRTKKHYKSKFNANEEFRNGSIKVVLNSNNSNDANVKISNNNKDSKVDINNKHSIVGINNKCKIATAEIINDNNNNIIFTKNSKDIKIKNDNSSNDVKNEFNNDKNNNIKNNQNSINQNSLNQNNINQNNINQNNINQNNINQNNINQNNINQNIINSNDFNFNTLLGRNVFIYNFQNSGDFVMSSMPLFNNNNNNNNQNNNDMQRVPSYEENEPLPEYSVINKSMTKQQFM